MALSYQELKDQTSFLSKDPLDRAHKKLKGRLDEQDIIFDVHTHIFGDEHVPDHFLGMKVDASKAWADVLATVIFVIDQLPFLEIADLTRLLKRLRMKKEDHLNYLVSSYRKFGYDPILVTLMVDMSSIKDDGMDYKNIWDQLEEMHRLWQSHPDTILPFVALDPEMNDDMEELFIKAFKDYNFFGVKIYPSLGYLPSHPRLMPIFEICQKYSIPVLTHCSSALTRATSRKFNIKTSRVINGKIVPNPVEFKEFPKQSRKKEEKDYRLFFNGPEHWIPVLEAYPKLKLNLAHFGGNEEWEIFTKTYSSKWITTILMILQDPRFENVYSDFSFTFNYRKYNKILKRWLKHNPIVSERTLHGSDYFLTATKRKLTRILRGYFKDIDSAEWIKKIGVDNATEYLFKKV